LDENGEEGEEEEEGRKKGQRAKSRATGFSFASFFLTEKRNTWMECARYLGT